MIRFSTMPILSPTTSSKLASLLFLPEVLTDWPWPRQINKYYEEISTDSSAWLHTFKAFNGKSQVAFDKCDFGLLASLVYPTATKEHLRTGCDLMNLFFVIDEYTDVESASVVCDYVNVILDALSNPNKTRPDNEVILGEITRQFWALAIETTPADIQQRFISSFTDYLNAVVEQAADRTDNKTRSVEEYFKTRRQNIGCCPSFALGQLGINLPPEVYSHPSVEELEYLCTEIIILANDMMSYNKEQATGDDRQNVLTIIMEQFNTDVASAMALAGRCQIVIQEKFVKKKNSLPSFGSEVDKELAKYVFHLANFPRGNECWGFECGRYFGSKGRDIQKSRLIEMLPKVERDTTLKANDLVLLDID